MRTAVAARDDARTRCLDSFGIRKRPRSEAPPAVTVAVRAPSPTTSQPRARALSTARWTRARLAFGLARCGLLAQMLVLGLASQLLE